MSFLTTAVSPSVDLYREGGILVNNRGERFTDELGRPNQDTARQPDRVAWIVFDSVVAAKFSAWPYYISTAPGVAYAYLDDYRRNRPDIFHKADSIAQLAARMGVPAQGLERTLAQYNAGERGNDRRSNKDLLRARPGAQLRRLHRRRPACEPPP